MALLQIFFALRDISYELHFLHSRIFVDVPGRVWEYMSTSATPGSQTFTNQYRSTVGRQSIAVLQQMSINTAAYMRSHKGVLTDFAQITRIAGPILSTPR